MAPRASDRIQGSICGFIITGYWLYGTVVPWYSIIMPHYTMGQLGWPSVAVFGFLSIMTIFSFYRAMFSDPGCAYLRPVTPSPGQDWPYCITCQAPKRPRSHHCTRCNSCILKMDHHCPWINNCVGQGNQWAFVQLLYYALGFSVFAAVVVFKQMYVWPKCPPDICPETSIFVMNSTLFTCVTISLSVSMAVSMTIMVSGMNFTLVLDVTTVEGMKNPTIYANRTDYPFRSFSAAYTDLCGAGPVWLWPFPCRQLSGYQPLDQAKVQDL